MKSFVINLTGLGDCMLESLHIKNLALIDSIHIDFSPGFTILSGETGAGKSIILGL